MRESFVLHGVLKNWGAHPRLRIWRQNTGVARFAERVVRFGFPGLSDVLGIIAPWGRFLAVETKTKDGKLSPAQETFRRMVIAFGGVHVVARTPEDMDQAMADLGITR